MGHLADKPTGKGPTAVASPTFSTPSRAPSIPTHTIWKIVIWKSDIYSVGPSAGVGLMPKTIFSGENQAVVQVLRDARISAGLTQAQLAARLGRDQSHVSLVEGSQRRLDVVEFLQFGWALGVDPLDLLGRIVAVIEQRAN